MLKTLDVEVVKQIAEFMGYKDLLKKVWIGTGVGPVHPQRPNQLEYPQITGVIEVDGGPLGVNDFREEIPDYLNSYDALAPVWKKIIGFSLGLKVMACLGNYETADNLDPTLFWVWRVSPYQHALAIARVLKDLDNEPSRYKGGSMCVGGDT